MEGARTMQTVHCSKNESVGIEGLTAQFLQCLPLLKLLCYVLMKTT